MNGRQRLIFDTLREHHYDSGPGRCCSCMAAKPDADLTAITAWRRHVSELIATAIDAITGGVELAVVVEGVVQALEERAEAARNQPTGALGFLERAEAFEDAAQIVKAAAG